MQPPDKCKMSESDNAYMQIRSATVQTLLNGPWLQR